MTLSYVWWYSKWVVVYLKCGGRSDYQQLQDTAEMLHSPLQHNIAFYNCLVMPSKPDHLNDSFMRWDLEIIIYHWCRNEFKMWDTLLDK